MNDNILEQQLCSRVGHDKQLLTQYCLNLNCKEARICCGFCLDYHHDHLQEILSINQIKSFIFQYPSLGSHTDLICQCLQLLQKTIMNRIQLIIQSKKELGNLQAPNFMFLFNPDKSKNEHTQLVTQLRQLSNIIQNNQQWELSLIEEQENSKIQQFDNMISQSILQSLDQYQNYLYQVHYDNNFDGFQNVKQYDQLSNLKLQQNGNTTKQQGQQQEKEQLLKQLQLEKEKGLQYQQQIQQQQLQLQQLQQQGQQQQVVLQQQALQQQQRPQQDQIVREQNQMQGSSKFLFNEALQIQFKIWDEEKTVIRRLDRDNHYGQSQDGYFFALLDHSIQYYNRNVIYAFELQERDDSIRNYLAKLKTFYVGIANPKIIKELKFKLDPKFSGCYLIGTNGYSQSFDINYQNRPIQFKFNLGDTIICSYNYQQRIITFKKLYSNSTFSFQIDNQSYHPCICLDYFPWSGIFIKIINEEELKLKNYKID